MKSDRPPDEISKFPSISETRSSPEVETGTRAGRPGINPAERSSPDCQYKPGDNLGRYSIIRELGTGGFGHVLLAEDPKLRRQVAIKIPRLDRLERQKLRFLEEGRSVARLDHASIIKVFNIEETDDGTPFAVMEYVEGPTLQYVIRHDGLSFSQSLKFLIQIADALAYAHGQTLIHRDLKPSNVIVGNDGQTAKLMDFGMALHDLTPDGIISRSPEGTPPYMAPEQVRGENHRLDRRTDIWSFGVVMYVMLTGRRPFTASDITDLIEDICLKDPRPPTRINRQVPAELERICLRCLEKLMGARYQHATDLGDDLRSFESGWQNEDFESQGKHFSGVLPIAGGSVSGVGSTDQASSTHESELGSTNVVKVVPKGLRSFDAQDADFFVDLLPGPKDRFGVPDSLRFWISRILGKSTDSLTVGLLFGPSGCGKSSFVKAGLLPRLSGSVDFIYLEATPGDTEEKLAEKIESVTPIAIHGDAKLATTLNRIRRGHAMKGRKLLIVIDQFEQWLHNHSDLSGQPLIEALRQCDGENLCCLLMVRDDFWMSATQFMSQLDLKVQEGVNALGIPLFDRRHARKVLTAYGRATEAIEEDPTESQLRFISDAVAEISDNGRIIPIHLALFAQMMDSDSWNAVQLKRMGGWQGIGVHFLKTIFSEKRMARHEQNGRVILKQLLPEGNAEIKGAQKSVRQLVEATGDPVEHADVASTIEILDRELRIITPTESENGRPGQQYYQLSHDFLVNPIRTWLMQREKQSWQGRSRIRMEELAAQWQSQQQSRFLPSPIEYLAMMFGSRARQRSDVETDFLRRASRYYGSRSVIFLVVAILIGWGSVTIWHRSQFLRAQEQFNSLLIGGSGEVGARLELLEPFGKDTVKKLVGKLPVDANSKEKLHCLFAQSHFGTAGEIPIDDLLSAAATADSGQSINIVDALRPLLNHPRRQNLLDRLHDSFAASTDIQQKTRLAVIAMHLGETDLLNETLQLRKDPEIREQFIESYPGWRGRIDEAIAAMENAKEVATITGLAKAIGLIPIHELSPTDIQRLAKVAGEFFVTHDSPAVHSSAAWLLHKLDVPHPEPTPRQHGDAWFVKEFGNGEKITFLRVDSQIVPVGAGLDPSELKMFSQSREDQFLDHGFYMSSQEIRATLFLQFVETLEPDDPTRKHFENHLLFKHRHDNIPIFNLNWNEAVRFCNWLSERDERSLCYQRNQSNDGWVPVPAANGYRLATNLEWDAANRAGTTTRFFFGDLSTRLGRYATTEDHEFPIPGLNIGYRGQKMPNENGFFDTIGNASEWCQDGNPNRDTPNFRTLRGGQTLASTRWLTSGCLFDQSTNSRLSEPGLRIVVDLKNKGRP